MPEYSLCLNLPSQSHSPPPGRFQNAPSLTHPPSLELPMIVSEGPNLSSLTGLRLLLFSPVAVEGELGGPFHPRGTTGDQEITPIIRRAELSVVLTSPRPASRSRFFSVLNRLFLSLGEKGQSPPARHRCPPLIWVHRPQTLKQGTHLE